MKLKQSSNFTITSGNFKKLSYTMDSADFGMVFSIFRSRFYSNQIGSICREIASNARDANREVGTPDKPIEVEIIKESPFFPGKDMIVFRDAGPGISPERMETVYCKYAKSTKRDSNDETGAFGLGAKSPFAYSDSFSVVTCVDGVKYTYVNALDETDKGEIILVSEKPTDQPNGTAIVIPLENNNDRDRFERELIYYTQYWKARPVLKGFSRKYENLNLEIDTEDFSLYKNEDDRYASSCNHFVLIDEIPYPVDRSHVPVVKNLYGKNIIYKFGNGVLDIIPSRENLQYTTETVELISAKFRKMQEYLARDVKSFLNSGKSYLDFCIRVSAVTKNSGLFDESYKMYTAIFEFCDLKIEDFKYNGKQAVINLNEIRCFEFLHMKDQGDKIVANRMTKIDGRFADGIVYEMDMTRRMTARNRGGIQKHPDGFIIMQKKQNVTAKDYTETIKENLETLKYMGVKVDNYSSLPSVYADKKGNSSSSYQRYKAKHFIVKAIPIKKDGYYGDGIKDASIDIYVDKKTGLPYLKEDDVDSLMKPFAVYTTETLYKVRYGNFTRHNQHFNNMQVLSEMMDVKLYVIAQSNLEKFKGYVITDINVTNHQSGLERLQKVVNSKYVHSNASFIGEISKLDKSLIVSLLDVMGLEAGESQLAIDVFDEGTQLLKNLPYRSDVMKLAKDANVKVGDDIKKIVDKIMKAADENRLIGFVLNNLGYRVNRSVIEELISLKK